MMCNVKPSERQQQQQKQRQRRVKGRTNEGGLPRPVFKAISQEIAVVDDVKHACNICSKTFYHISALQVHLLLHTSTLPRKKIADFADEIQRTKKTVSKTVEAQVDFAALETKEARPRRHEVDVSPKFFHRFELNLSRLDANAKKSSSSAKKASCKQYACSICGKAFTKKTSMRIHQTKRHVHTREFLIFV